MSTKNIIIVEDDILICEDIKRVVQNQGYKVLEVFHSGENAIKALDRIQPDLILMDIVLSGRLNGIETTGKINEKSDVPVVFLTAYSDQITTDRMATVKHFGRVLKPFRDEELIRAIEKVFGEDDN